MNDSFSGDKPISNNLVSLSDFKAKKEVRDSLSPDRKPLYVSYLENGRMFASPHANGPKPEDFSDRLQRIRTSLERINHLMAELKKMDQKQ